MVDYFADLRARDGAVSLRDLALRSGLKHTRLGDLFNKQNGTPTLQEFIDLCLVFGVDPADSLKLIVEQVERESLIDRASADPDRYGVAALRDENKSRENQGGEGR